MCNFTRVKKVSVQCFVGLLLWVKGTARDMYSNLYSNTKENFANLQLLALFTANSKKGIFSVYTAVRYTGLGASSFCV